MTDDELLAAMKDAATDLSYYNAAEGDCYSAERNGRAVAQGKWDALVKEAKALGIWNSDDWRGYLVNR